MSSDDSVSPLTSDLYVNPARNLLAGCPACYWMLWWDLCYWNSSFRLEPSGLMAMPGNMSGPLSMHTVTFDFISVFACGMVCHEVDVLWLERLAFVWWELIIIFRVWPMGWGYNIQLLDLMKCSGLIILVYFCLAAALYGDMRKNQTQSNYP